MVDGGPEYEAFGLGLWVFKRRVWNVLFLFLRFKGWIEGLNCVVLMIFIPAILSFFCRL